MLEFPPPLTSICHLLVPKTQAFRLLKFEIVSSIADFLVGNEDASWVKGNENLNRKALSLNSFILSNSADRGSGSTAECGFVSTADHGSGSTADRGSGSSSGSKEAGGSGSGMCKD